MKMTGKDKEEYAIILEYLPNGYPLEGKMMPIAQAIGERNLILLELVPRRGTELKIGERVYIGEGKRDKIYYILGRLHREKLTEPAKENLQEFIAKIVNEREKEFIDFFNKADAINKRIHQIELLPGLGKKHMKEILEKRKEKPFLSFDEMKKRIQNLPDPSKSIEKRIFQELVNIERHNLFTK
jgi:putative nucleotide binding protein